MTREKRPRQSDQAVPSGMSRVGVEGRDGGTEGRRDRGECCVTREEKEGMGGAECDRAAMLCDVIHTVLQAKPPRENGRVGENVRLTIGIGSRVEWRADISGWRMSGCTYLHILLPHLSYAIQFVGQNQCMAAKMSLIHSLGVKLRLIATNTRA